MIIRGIGFAAGWILGDILFDKFLKAPIEDLADKIADTIKNNRKG